MLCHDDAKVAMPARQAQCHQERGCPGAGRAGQAVPRAQAVRAQEDGQHRLHRQKLAAEEGLYQLQLHLRGGLCPHLASCSQDLGPGLSAPAFS